MKRVLIIGGGGREHALAWKLRQSPQVSHICVAPGNGGTETVAETVNVKATDLDGMLNLAETMKADLVVVGPEIPLSLGFTDRFAAEGFDIFGPSQAAARLETSKIFAKQFMTRYKIPTAPYRIASGFAEAQAHVRDLGTPVAIKADGLAAGKGVTLCQTTKQADDALHKALVEDVFGAAGHSVVIEGGLSGEEVSVLAFCDQSTVVPMVVAQDHKAVFDNDRGPNTGGMGCYAPTPFVNSAELDDIAETFLQLTIDGMREEGTPFRGVLYAGLMLTEDGPQLLEYNTRFGDPETQTILPLLDADLFEILQACVDDTLDKASIRWLAEACVCLICASEGYPGFYAEGLPITGLLEAETEGTVIFHSGTRREDGKVVTAGGRVLGITCQASDLPAAIDQAYSAVRSIHFDGMHYRRDIGAKAFRK